MIELPLNCCASQEPSHLNPKSMLRSTEVHRSEVIWKGSTSGVWSVLHSISWVLGFRPQLWRGLSFSSSWMARSQVIHAHPPPPLRGDHPGHFFEVTMDNHLSFFSHTASLMRSCCFHLYKITRILISSSSIRRGQSGACLVVLDVGTEELDPSASSTTCF